MKKAGLIAILLLAAFLVSCGGDDLYRSPSANEISRVSDDISEPIEQETSGATDGINLPDDIF